MFGVVRMSGMYAENQTSRLWRVSICWVTGNVRKSTNMMFRVFTISNSSTILLLSQKKTELIFWEITKRRVPTNYRYSSFQSSFGVVWCHFVKIRCHVCLKNLEFWPPPTLTIFCLMRVGKPRVRKGEQIVQCAPGVPKWLSPGTHCLFFCSHWGPFFTCF